MDINDIMYGATVPDVPLRTRAFLVIAFVATGLAVVLAPFAFFSKLGFQAVIVFGTAAVCYYIAALIVRLTKSDASPES